MYKIFQAVAVAFIGFLVVYIFGSNKTRDNIDGGILSIWKKWRFVLEKAKANAKDCGEHLQKLAQQYEER